MLRETVVASALLATAIILLSGVTNHLTLGLSAGAGLMLGSGNGYLVLALVKQGTSFVASSMFRLVCITVVMLMASFVFGLTIWPAVLGLAASQLIMVAASVRQGLRA